MTRSRSDPPPDPPKKARPLRAGLRSATKGREPVLTLAVVADVASNVRALSAVLARAKRGANAIVVQEVVDLLEFLRDRQRRPTYALEDLLFQVHATYSRDEVSAGLLALGDKGKLIRTQGGVYEVKSARADVFFVTLEKDAKHFTPTTLYNDYPISQSRFHWESQGKTRADSRTGRRYQGLVEQPWRTLLFVRKGKAEASGVTSPYLFLGPVRYVSHEGEKPMRIVWDLERPMPSSFFNEVKVAAG
ncbi:MAG: DUF3427 domain-containing protein [Deltaproteobacteria bacterium]|nr:DUF3427 domain-containing protein [Deltaproteobacteria bacterium]